jgi:hypothetical protein
VKKAAAVVLLLAVVLAGAAFWAYESIDLIVKLALEHYGPQVTGVEVKVGEVHLSPTDGIGNLSRVEIGNPPGFSSTHALRVQRVALSVDPATLRAPLVHIREITIEQPAIVYERGAKGTNLDAIRRNIAAYVKEADEASSGAGDKTPAGRDVRHLFVIDTVAIRGAKVTMTSAGLKGGGITFDLPEVVVRDIGKRAGGATASQAASVVADALVAAIAQKVLTNFELLRKGGVEGAMDALKGLLH